MSGNVKAELPTLLDSSHRASSTSSAATGAYQMDEFGIGPNERHGTTVRSKKLMSASGLICVVLTARRHFRFTPMNGHFQCPSACLERSNKRH